MITTRRKTKLVPNNNIMVVTMNCTRCKREVADGRKKCQYHLDLYRTYSLNWQSKMREQGRCQICGNPSPAKLCERCTESKYIASKKWNESAIKRAICLHCADPVEKGRRFCRRCIDKREVTDKKYTARMRKEGRCPKCTRPVDEFSLLQNKKTCMVCRQGKVT